MFTVFGIVLIFVLWLMYEKRKTSRFSEKKTKSFWQREREADLVRRKDISDLPYIVIPYETLPFTDAGTEDVEIYEIQNSLYTLKDLRIINLTGYTNTDLKYMYGTPNLPLLSEYDHNFTRLTRYLYKWAGLLMDRGDVNSAKTVLEFGIECGTDISGNYILLAEIYSSEQDVFSIQDLIIKAENIRTLMKDSTIAEIKKMLK